MESNEVVNQVLKYIEQHIEEPMSIQQIAEYAGYSEYHFARIFKKYMNVTLLEYVTKRKLIRASEAILSGKKIIDVAVQYGWQSHSGFTKAFKKEFGFYPALLRVMLAEMQSLGGIAMNHIFLETTNPSATKEELFEILKSKVKENGIDINAEMLENIYQCSINAYEGVRRYSGDEYVTHLLNVAIVLAELGAQSNVICAGMFCDVSKKGRMSMEKLADKLPRDIMDIVRCTNEAVGKNIEEFDDEVLMIKLAERLHNMRTVEYMEKEKQKVKAKETIELFIPMARKIGNKKLIDELADLSMKYI